MNRKAKNKTKTPKEIMFINFVLLSKLRKNDISILHLWIARIFANKCFKNMIYAKVL